MTDARARSPFARFRAIYFLLAFVVAGAVAPLTLQRLVIKIEIFAA